MSPGQANTSSVPAYGPARPAATTADADDDAELEALLAADESLELDDDPSAAGEGNGSRPPTYPDATNGSGQAGASGVNPDDTLAQGLGFGVAPALPSTSPTPAHAPGATPEPFGPGGSDVPEPGPVFPSPDPGPAPVLAGPPDPATFPGVAEGDAGDGGDPTDDSEIAGPAPTGRGRARHRQGRRVRQRLWSVDPWSVFKISVMFYACMFVILMVAGTLLWNVGRSSGTIDQFEGFITNLGAYGECLPEEEVAEDEEFETDDDCPDGTVQVDGFVLDDATVFRAAAITGAVVAIAGSAGNVLMTVLLNLINEVSGGMRYTIIREPSAPRRPSRVRSLSGSLRTRIKR